MQSIYAIAPRSQLMVPLAGSALGSLLVGVGTTASPGAANRPWLLAGAAADLVQLGITAGYHVPRNNALARLPPQAQEAAAVWASFVHRWTTATNRSSDGPDQVGQHDPP